MASNKDQNNAMEDKQDCPRENEDKALAKSVNKARNKEKVKNVVHLWDKEEIGDLLRGVILAALEKRSDFTIVEDAEKIQPAANPVDEISTEIRICEKMFCATCSVSFEERDDQTEHFKSDWHRFNLKRRLRTQEIASEQKFEEITNAGDLSSISGSDSSADEEDQSFSQPPEDEDMDCHLEGIGKRHPRIFMRNTSGELFSVYRCVVHGKKNQAESTEALISMVTELPQVMTWAIFMLAGGHFAAAIFDGNSVVEHKTFHRYVVRAKRGTVQSSRDGKGHAPKSGGASLRRYNEAALAQEIQDLLGSWSSHIKRCSRIFIRVPTYSKSTFYSGKTPILHKADSRIRLIPFQTRRPTFKELHRVHELLTTVECYGSDSHLEDHITVSPKKVTLAAGKSEPAGQKVVQHNNITLEPNKASAYDSEDEEINIEMVAKYLTIDTQDLQPFEVTRKPKKKKKNKENQPYNIDESLPFPKFTDPESMTLRNELYTACKTKNTEQLKSLLEDMKTKHTDSISTKTIEMTSNAPNQSGCSAGLTVESVSSITLENCEEESNKSTTPMNQVAEMLNCPFGDHGLTLLHVAAVACHKDAITMLMESGADPCLKDGQGQLPYISAPSKDSRNQFRRFMASYPDMYDYQKAQIPGPLSEDQEKDKKAREAERKRMLRKSKKERMKDQKAQEALVREEEQEIHRYLALSDREKRALAAEKRLTTQIVSSGEAAPILLRCFQCGIDITGKVPFEYGEYKFCTTRCLKEHRLAQNLKKS